MAVLIQNNIEVASGTVQEMREEMARYEDAVLHYSQEDIADYMVNEAQTKSEESKESDRVTEELTLLIAQMERDSWTGDDWNTFLFQERMYSLEQEMTAQWVH